MAASSSGEFEEWLDNELNALNTDQEVFGGYIKSILEGDETDDEKIEALEGILSEITEEIITPLCKEILLKWTLRNLSENAGKNEKTFDVNEKFVTIMEQQTQRVNTMKKLQLRKNGTEMPLWLSTVKYPTTKIVKAEKERREQAKLDTEKKKAQDKVNREKQKQQQLERKEKEKKRTQKGEKRR
uniref:Coiled-coil domain-containing protein 43 n=1 Tax=Strigamia maritima TaxID=126957 RepID=T1JD44_STRMM